MNIDSLETLEKKIKIWPDLQRTIDDYLHKSGGVITIWQCNICLNTHICSGQSNIVAYCVGMNCFPHSTDDAVAKSRAEMWYSTRSNHFYHHELKKFPKFIVDIN